MRPFSLLVKPISADCNLECEYCFYLEKKNLYPGVARHQMTSDVLERMIAQYMKTPQPVYSFGWQGGEPTLMGRRFFEKIIELQERYAPRGAQVTNGLQTNGTLLTDTLAGILARNHYLVGISVDGPPEVHDQYRTTVSGRGTQREVLRGLETLRRNGVEHNVLTVVSQANVRSPRRIYRYLKELGVDYHQYIPCVEFNEDGSLRDYSITGAEWGAFLNAIYDEWIAEDVGKVSIRQFDSVLSVMLDGVPTMCTMAKNCRQYFVVEHNGDVYPCDFFVRPERRLGNVAADSFVDLWKSPEYRAFGLAKKHWNPECEQCPFLRYCAGDCPKHRVPGGTAGAGGINGADGGARRSVPGGTAGASSGTGTEDPRQLSVLCEGWKAFYGHTLEGFRDVAGAVSRARAAGRERIEYYGG